MRKSTIIVGAQREGKTYYAESVLTEYAKKGGVAVAYNVGRPSDFSRFISVSLITPDVAYTMAKKAGKKIRMDDIPFEIGFFSVNERIYKIQDFCRLFRGKCVKIERLNPNKREENLLFEAIYKYFYNAIIVMDDFRSVTRHGLSKEFIQLSSRQNHTGFKLGIPAEMCGIDMFIVYHAFSTVSVETYDYINSIVQFRTASPPDLKGNNDELQEVLTRNYSELRDMPKYSRIEVDTISYLTKKIEK